MSWREHARRTRLDILRGILLVGLTTAVAVFLTAANPADDPLGQSPARIPRSTAGSMEMVGGQANLVASDITDWITGLWQGRPWASPWPSSPCWRPMDSSSSPRTCRPGNSARR